MRWGSIAWERILDKRGRAADGAGDDGTGIRGLDVKKSGLALSRRESLAGTRWGKCGKLGWTGPKDKF
jgi:hypothetical protein